MICFYKQIDLKFGIYLSIRNGFGPVSIPPSFDECQSNMEGVLRIIYDALNNLTPYRIATNIISTICTTSYCNNHRHNKQNQTTVQWTSLQRIGLIGIEHVTPPHCNGPDHIVTKRIAMKAITLRHTPPGTKTNSTAPHRNKRNHNNRNPILPYCITSYWTATNH